MFFFPSDLSYNTCTLIYADSVFIVYHVYKFIAEIIRKS